MTRAQPLLSAVMALVACGNEADRPGRDASAPPTEVRQDGGAKTERDATVSGFSVSLEASKVELCAGECADLRVSPRNVEGSVRYAWSDGLPVGETQHVCPASTHTYEVDATASTTRGEFTSERQASDGITISVRDCSMPKDDGVLCELRHRFDLPSTGDVFAATKPWVSLDTYPGSGAIRATPDGGAWVVGSFGMELDLGAGRVTTDAPFSTFLHKLDKDCKPVRTLVLRATNPGDATVPSALAVDDQGNAYVASVGGPVVEFNLLSPVPIRWTNEILIEKIAPSGESLYRRRIGSNLGCTVHDLEVNAAGEVFMSGVAPATTDLGSGWPIGLSPTVFHTFALKLAADGRHAAQRVDTGSYQIAVGGDLAFDISITDGSYDFLSLLFPVRFTSPILALSATSQSDLKTVWTKPYDPEVVGYPELGEGIRSGGIALLYGERGFLDDSGTQHFRNVIRRYGADGTMLRQATFLEREVKWEEPSADAGPFAQLLTDSLYFPFLRESEPETMVMVGNFYRSQTIAGTPLVAEQLDDMNPWPYYLPSAFVLKLDRNDQVRWIRQQDWGDVTYVRGLGSLTSGEVFVAGQARVDARLAEAPDAEYDLVVRKLRAD